MEDVVINRRKLLGTAAAAGVVVAGGGLFLTGGSGGNRAMAQDEEAATATPIALGPPVPEEFNTETNWAAENLDLASTRDVKGSSISSETVGTLGGAWTFPVQVSAAFGALTANPSIVGDLIFIQDAAANVYALNKETGEQIWANRYDDVVPSGGPNGVAAAYGLLFTTIGGVGDVVALKQESGEEVWRTNIQGPLGEGITTFPLVYDSMVFVSTIPGSSEGFYAGGQRGVIHALDAQSGQVMWYFDTTTDNLWGNPTVNSGGGFWHPPSVDENGHLYVPIGNPAPYPGAEGFPWGTSREGDNLYTDSILKMNPQDATLEWYYQVKPHDLFDLDNQLSPVLADVDGQKLVYTSGKHGIVVCLNRETGEVVWQTPVGTHQNDDMSAPPEDENASIEVFPGTLGGVETSMAYSAANNLLIAPVYELSTTYIGTDIDPEAGFNFTTATGIMVALNGSDGSIVWQTELATGPLVGATIVNDVVFSAGLDGVIQGFNIADGSEVFRYQATAGINAQAAVSGDYIYFPAGGPLIPSANTTDPAPDVVQQVIALKLGGEIQVAATPAADGVNPQATPEDSGVMPSDSTPEADS
jgi:outer membrane protein assembly factor BamB